MSRISPWLLFALVPLVPVAARDNLVDPAYRVAPDDPAWRDIASAFAHKPDATAEFTEQRFFPFKKAPLALAGEVRISKAHGLSLRYTAPSEQIVVMDSEGMIVRQPDGREETPPDPRANVANAALLHALRFELPALAADFELFGRREGPEWTLVIVPRTRDLRRVLAEIVVTGEAAAVRRIELRRAAKQYVEIHVGAARSTPFTDAELKRFFR